MRLSEAILAGSMLIKPIPYYRHRDNGSGCALGMGEVAAGCGQNKLESVYPWLLFSVKATPCGCSSITYPDGLGVHSYSIETFTCAIAHIFNEHVMGDKTWTLERLCDWVDSVDPTPREYKTVHEIVDDVIKKHKESDDDAVDTDDAGCVSGSGGRGQDLVDLLAVASH